MPYSKCHELQGGMNLPKLLCKDGIQEKLGLQRGPEGNTRIT